MDAIPSLCATTASCGAAAIGYVYGTSSSYIQEYKGRTDGASNHETPIRPTTFTDVTPATPTPLRRLHNRRPQSASIPHTVSLWDKGEDSTTARRVEEVGSGLQAEQSSPWAPIGATVESRNTIRAPWTRRMSTIAQSHDGSSLSSARPSSPSLFSNGSNAPFFSSNQTVTPRNRLVKRSTSHRVLHSATYHSSPISNPQTPTFRRPATSHQRSEQLRLQTLQRELQNPSEPPQLDLVGIPSAELERPQELYPTETEWSPYFERSVVQLLRDTPLRGTALSRGTGGFDSIRCVLPRSGFAPSLLKPSAIRQVKESAKTFPSVANRQTPQEPSTSSDAPRTGEQSQPKGPRPRHSFSLGDIMATPTPSNWKIRRSASVKKPSLTEGISSRRAVSAPQRNLLQTTSKAVPSDDSPAMVHGVDSTKESTASQSRSQPPRGSSSPLPPLQRLSAFDIDLLAVSPPESPTQDNHLADSSNLPPSPGSSSENHGQSSLRIRPHRTSRIPSDRASTVFSSDNEQGRVFSTDGDDFDRRSETVYDSIRTDATSSSHSGAKGQHAETVFQYYNDPGLSSPGLQALQDRLAQSHINSSLPQDLLQSRETVADSSQHGAMASAELHSASQRIFPIGSATGNAATTPTPHPRQGSTVTPQNDEFWSIEEEDSNWGDPDTAELDGLVQSVEDDGQDDTREGNRSSASNPFMTADAGTRISLQSYIERGGRSTGRRAPAALHLRSQSVPLQPDNQGYRFNNVTKLDAWMLGGKGVSEDWDGDFEFDEPHQPTEKLEGCVPDHDKEQEQPGVLVPPAILERQASVHGQFGQVKQFSQLVEELRVLHHKAHLLGILHGQSSELWREAEGIIDLATLDEDDVPYFPHSPNSSSFDFEAFEEDQSISNRTIKEQSPADDSLSTSAGAKTSDSFAPQQGTPTRPRGESIAKAKHILENMTERRVPDEKIISKGSGSPRKFHFDTTSLRDLVTRAGVVTRALAEIVRRMENPDQNTPTPERRAQTPSDPAFSQIFQNSPTPSSSRKSPRVHRRRSSNSFLKDSPSPAGSDRNGHISIMSVV